MTEEEDAKRELFAMNQAQLDLVPYTTVWWLCCYKGCYNGTRIRDYGISPEFWKKQYGFFSIYQRFILCEKHFKFYKRLKLHYSLDHIDRAIFDRSGKPFYITNEEKIKIKNNRVSQKELIHKKPKS